MTNLKDIAKHLVEKHELTAADAEYFVAQFIETLQDSVLSEKLVKVKGLGAFKLTPISARESIDVNSIALFFLNIARHSLQILIASL